MTSDLLQDVDAAELRREQRDFMPSTCALYNVTEVNVGGRVTLTRELVPVYDGPCRLIALGQAEKERILAGAVDASAYYRLVLPAGTAVARTQEVDVTGATRTDDGDVAYSLTLSVVGFDPPHTATQISQKVLCKAVAA